MFKPKDPKELVVQLLKRSQCAVQVAAVIESSTNGSIHTWGWNHAGSDGYGQHAEAHCISRGNGMWMVYGTIYVAARRKRNGRVVTAKPCEKCQQLIDKYGLEVKYRDGNGSWVG